jgi:hypothetical protein
MKTANIDRDGIDAIIRFAVNSGANPSSSCDAAPLVCAFLLGGGEKPDEARPANGQTPPETQPEPARAAA